MKTAFITGISGQDGSYLCDLLLDKGYTVHGTTRSSRSLANGNLRRRLADPAVYNSRLFLHVLDVFNDAGLEGLIGAVEPAPLCGCAAKIHAALGWKAHTSFGAVVARLVDHEIEHCERGSGSIASVLKAKV